MLQIKQQGEMMKWTDSPVIDEFDGPPSALAETSTGNQYVYSSYGLMTCTSTVGESFLWSSIFPTLQNILDESGWDDPVILWRTRPEIDREDGKSCMYMRCVAIPRDEVDKIIAP